jgi:hypothetical protein
MISTGSKIRLGSESNVLAIENAQSINDSVVSMTLKYVGDYRVFSAIARRLPLSVSEYETADSNHAFNGLYASTNSGASAGTDTCVVAISSDSIVVMTAVGTGWMRQKTLASVSGTTLNTLIGIKITYNPLTGSTPPYQTGCCQFYNGSQSQQLVGVDGLGR